MAGQNPVISVYVYGTLPSVPWAFRDTLYLGTPLAFVFFFSAKQHLEGTVGSLFVLLPFSVLGSPTVIFLPLTVLPMER